MKLVVDTDIQFPHVYGGERYRDPAKLAKYDGFPAYAGGSGTLIPQEALATEFPAYAGVSE